MGLFDFLKKDEDALEDPVIVVEEETSAEENLELPVDESKVEKVTEKDIPEDEAKLEAEANAGSDDVEVVDEKKDEDGNVVSISVKDVPAAKGEVLASAPAPMGATRTVRPKYGTTGTIGPAPRFTWGEVHCNDGTRIPAKYKPYAVRLARSLNLLRYHIAKKYGVSTTRVYISVNSWYRTPAYNARIGGVGNSTHTTGMAGDITVSVKGRDGRMRRVPTKTVAYQATKCYRFRNGGIGRYSNFTHLDVRGYKARWYG